MAKVTMPQLGESVAEGTIGKWLKQPGDHVDKYEPLLEVITDKVNAEVPSPFEGVLKEILAEEGDTVPNNAEIAVIETADDGASNGTAPTDAKDEAAAAVNPPVAAESPGVDAGAAGETPKVAADDTPPPEVPGPAGSDESVNGSSRAAATASAPTATASAPTATAAPAASAPPAANPPAANGDPDARMTPAVRRLLREHGLSAEQIVGTGGGGRITRDDVLAVVETIRTGGQAPAAGAAADPSMRR